MHPEQKPTPPKTLPPREQAEKLKPDQHVVLAKFDQSNNYLCGIVRSGYK